MKRIIASTLFIKIYCLVAGPGLGSLLDGINDAGTMHGSDGSAAGASIPVDGGLTMIIGASVWYGAKKINEYKNLK